MSKNTPTPPRSKTARIYYGISKTNEHLYWTVRVRDARVPVHCNGSVRDAIKGEPGAVIGCHLSQCAVRNASAFPHPCLFASFTKSTALIITKIKGGRPTEAVRYQHHYGKIVHLNDIGANKRRATRPTSAELHRRFTLYPPGKRNVIPSRTRQLSVLPSPVARKRSVMLKGATARAVTAGIISPGMLKMLAAA